MFQNRTKKHYNDSYDMIKKIEIKNWPSEQKKYLNLCIIHRKIVYKYAQALINIKKVQYLQDYLIDQFHDKKMIDDKFLDENTETVYKKILFRCQTYIIQGPLDDILSYLVSFLHFELKDNGFDPMTEKFDCCRVLWDLSYLPNYFFVDMFFLPGSIFDIDKCSKMTDKDINAIRSYIDFTLYTADMCVDLMKKIQNHDLIDSLKKTNKIVKKLENIYNSFNFV